MRRHTLCLMLCLVALLSAGSYASAEESAASRPAGQSIQKSIVLPQTDGTEETVSPVPVKKPQSVPVETTAPAQVPEEAEPAPEPQGETETVSGPYFLVDGAVVEDPGMTVYHDVTYVSLARAVKALEPDAVITWEGHDAVVRAEGLTIRLRVGDAYLEANGRYLYVPNEIIVGAGQVLVPVRTIAQAMGGWVDWNSSTGVVEVHSGGTPLVPGESYYDSDSVYWLSRIINAESGNQSLEGKLAVGTVIMNRVESPRFPNTIYEVIMAPNQFSPARTGAINREPNAESVTAAKLVLEGVRVGGNSLYFVNPTTSPNSWAQRNRPYVTTIGAHAFFG